MAASGTNRRYEHLVASLGNELFEAIRSAKILMVGAGGIGCELLKNLVLTGFHDIEIIDIDTIDLSNLNRQFLFQRKHIGMPKSQVAKESALRFNPDANILAHHGNIKDSKYGPEFFKKFTLVMNALDNIDARRHVNRLCIATETPLIESATEGYLGQIQVIKRGVMECYECQPKPAPKTYAYCTIRSSPTKPIHCIIWAKEEFLTHFGDQERVVNQEQEEEITDEEVKAEEAKIEAIKEKSFSEYLFRKLFYLEIYKKIRIAQLTKKDLWPGRETPVPIMLDQLHLYSNGTNDSTNSVESLPDQQIMSLKQNADLFIDSVNRLVERRSKTGAMDFDKDDDDALNFVTAASNLRSHIFTIPVQSRFSIKSLAGNIIPAIATTNAVIAGLIVVESFKILRNSIEKCRTVVLQKKPSAGRLLLSCASEKPNPDCYVCSSHFVTLECDTDLMTLGVLVEGILRGRLGMNEPSITVDSDILFESGEDLDEEEVKRMKLQSAKKLSECRIVNGTIIEIDDISQNFQLKISIVHKNNFAEEGQTFNIVGKATPLPTATKTKGEDKLDEKAQDDDEVMIVDAPAVPPPAPSKKRKAQFEEKDAKKSKVVSLD
ncbi:hypothetical protein PROFUN_08888 [Planoprotostelium fungivorum]|uniref:SUMO-activating enzyme subunit n=1 Tax=Planoprotostelium fungivorum TaxID=1890364 RepID=A0A2P6NIT5_9EUKA|nr:hypothetical protein PROFUN_08888 [Planoprotostelium fungivorum]